MKNYLLDSDNFITNYHQTIEITVNHMFRGSNDYIHTMCNIIVVHKPMEHMTVGNTVPLINYTRDVTFKQVPSQRIMWTVR